jgi:TPR repeat protein
MATAMIGQTRDQIIRHAQRDKDIVKIRTGEYGGRPNLAVLYRDGTIMSHIIGASGYEIAFFLKAPKRLTTNDVAALQRQYHTTWRGTGTEGGLVTWESTSGLYMGAQRLEDSDCIAIFDLSRINEITQSADEGSAEAQANLGSLYARGEGVPQDYKRAVELYQKAADKGYAPAQTALAILYTHGRGVAQDYKKAVELYQNAVAQGYPVAQVNLGWLYDEGRVVPQDYHKAVELYQKAADQGYATGQAYLASKYAQGKGVPRDYRKALDLFHKALDQGPHPNVFNDFAWFLATCPDDSQRNGKQAVEYATKACALTEWKLANFIGTLAAAYAEIGDFNAAIKYQKQAMGIPDTDYPDRQQMERSIELYGHQKPYREL